MTDAAPEPDPDLPEVEPVRTGVTQVDAVLTSLESLDGTEVAEHPAVFEQAHEQLHRALDGGS